MRRKLVIGNWKMNGNRAANAALLAGIVSGLKDVNDRADCAVCVPAPYLAQCEQELNCLLYTSPSPRDRQKSRMPSSA